MKKLCLFIALMLTAAAAQAAPWKNERLRVRVDLPKGWEVISAKMADRRQAASKEPYDSAFYNELARRLRAGRFFIFEEKKSGVRADLQYVEFGKPMRRLVDLDIRNLCPRWAESYAAEGKQLLVCSARRAGTEWVAYMEFAADPSGLAEHQLQHFDTTGVHMTFTVRGSRAQAQAVFKNTRFY